MIIGKNLTNWKILETDDHRMSCCFQQLLPSLKSECYQLCARGHPYHSLLRHMRQHKSKNTRKITRYEHTNKQRTAK